MRTLRIWLAVSCALALVVGMNVRVTIAQVAPVDPLASEALADASGGDGGSARGGDGGRGGSGIGGVCNQNVNDTYWAEDEPKLNCGAGGRGGDGGDAGESVGGNGGIAFAVGTPHQPSSPQQQPPPDVRQLLADLFVQQQSGSFLITVGNNGPDPAQSVQFSTVIKAEPPFGPHIFTGLGESSPTKGSCTTPEPATEIDSVSGITITCAFGDLAVGETVQLRIIWEPELECAGPATSVAQVSATAPPDPNLANNVSTFTEGEVRPECQES